jgi:hypothetical protein
MTYIVYYTKLVSSVFSNQTSRCGHLQFIGHMDKIIYDCISNGMYYKSTVWKGELSDKFNEVSDIELKM